MNRSVKTLRDVTKLLTSEMINLVFSVFFFIIIARIFTKMEMSGVAVWTIIVGLGTMLSGLGLVSTCIQRVPELLTKGEKTEASALMKSSVTAPFFLSLVVAGVVYVLSRQISQLFFKTTEFTALVRIMAIGIVIAELYEVLVYMLKVVDKFGKFSIATIVSTIPAKLLAFSFYWIFGINGYIFGLILGQSFAVFFMVYWLKDFLFFKSGFYSLKKLVVYSLPFYGYRFVRFGSMEVDQLIIGVLLMPEQLATYHVARRFLGYLILHTKALVGPIAPKISQLKTQGTQALQRAFSKTSRYLSFSLIPVSFLIASLAYALLEIYGGKKYIGGVPILVLLSLAAIPYGIYSIYALNIHIIGKPIKTFEQESISSILNIGLGLGLVIFTNVLGLAIARLLSLAGAALFSRYLLKRLSSAKFDTEALKRTVLASAIMAGIILICQLVYYNLYILPFYVLAGVSVYMFLFSRNLRREDLVLISDFIPARLSPLLKIVYFFGGAKLTQVMTGDIEKVRLER